MFEEVVRQEVACSMAEAMDPPSKDERSEARLKRIVLANRINNRQRALAYAGGLSVGLLSYFVYHWISAVEFMAAPRSFMTHLPTYEIIGFHPLSFVLWQISTVLATCVILYLWSRARRLGRIIEQGASIDGLTGICSHGVLQQVLETEVIRSLRYGRDLSMILLDLDDFNNSNEQYGHVGGDELLRWVAEQIVYCTRGLDTVARYGGDEFVILMPETPAEAAVTAAERVRAAIERSGCHRIGRKSLAVTVSVGVVRLSPDVKTRHALLLAADIALYHAKRQGKNRVSLYNPELNKTYRTSSSRLKSLLIDDNFGAIEALSAAVDAKDHNTRGHSESVMVYAVALGRRLGLSEPELENLRAAALLHDIGKIGMPDSILKKPGALEQGEWEVVESHTVVGSQILDKLHQLKTIVPGVKYHHERFDGMGYPNGLQGAQIPLLARIISLADSFDAMISDRSYRTAMSKVEALVEIERCAGTQFDPQLVELFVSTVKEELEAETETVGVAA